MPSSAFVALALAGLVAGLGLLARGLRAERVAARIGGVGTSPSGLLAAGEVRLTGQATSAGVTLTSRLRHRPCLYYRATVRVGEGSAERTVLDEERSVGFFVRDRSGQIRVFPRSAGWEVPLDAETETAEAEWARTKADLLSLTDPGLDPLHPGRSDSPDFAMPALVAASGHGSIVERAHYREARIEPGDIVTVVGRALPFRDLADPTEADAGGGDLLFLTGDVDANHVPDLGALQDPEVAAEYARARDDGVLMTDPRKAWGNAAIEGFGIGQPVRMPELDPRLGAAAVGVRAVAIDPVGAAQAASFGPHGADPGGAPGGSVPAAPGSSATARDFEIPPDSLVIAAGPDAPLLIAAGSPGQVWERSEQRFLVGLLGAGLAIGSAVLLALALSGAVGR